MERTHAKKSSPHLFALLIIDVANNRSYVVFRNIIYVVTELGEWQNAFQFY